MQGEDPPGKKPRPCPLPRPCRLPPPSIPMGVIKPWFQSKLIQHNVVLLVKSGRMLFAFYWCILEFIVFTVTILNLTNYIKHGITSCQKLTL